MTTTSTSAMVRVILFMLSLLCQDFPNALLRAAARQHQLMAAAKALELQIHPYAQHFPSRAAAGMLFF